VKIDEAMTISMLSGKLMVYSLTPRASCKDLLFRHNLSILYEDLLHTVDFPILIGVLLFGLIVGIIRI